MPGAHRLTPWLTTAERELAQITAQLVESKEVDEPVLLDRLTRLEAEIESRESEHHSRFTAATAYHELVQRRIQELREVRIQGLQTFQESTERRLAPTMNTCRSVSARLESLSQRVARATQLLSTRVDISRERQNQQVLESMNRRAAVQLRLQQTVEGLSAAAITYYVVGLVGYAAKGLASAGWPVNVELEVDRAVVLGPVAGDLDRDTLGGSPDRELILKWAGQDAAVLDMQGSARYLTRGGEPLIGFAPEIHAALLAQGAKLGSDASGGLRLWEIDARSALSGTLEQPRGLAQPIEFEGGLTLLGYDLRAQPDQPIDLVTYWRVDQTPAQPLSIFAHIVDAAGNLVAQRDGLNVRLSSLEPGDVVVQHFVIDHLATAAELRLGLCLSWSGS